MIAAKYVFSTCLLENGMESSSSFWNFSICLATQGTCIIMGKWEKDGRTERHDAYCIYAIAYVHMGEWDLYERMRRQETVARIGACAAYGRIYPYYTIWDVHIIQKMRSWKHHLYSIFNHFHDFFDTSNCVQGYFARTFPMYGCMRYPGRKVTCLESHSSWLWPILPNASKKKRKI